MYQKDHKIYQMTIKYTKLLLHRSNGHELNQIDPFTDPPKFTQIGIFCLKICHLATLPRVGIQKPLEESV
jgi:hypothetical protein